MTAAVYLKSQYFSFVRWINPQTTHSKLPHCISTLKVPLSYF